MPRLMPLLYNESGTPADWAAWCRSNAMKIETMTPQFDHYFQLLSRLTIVSNRPERLMTAAAQSSKALLSAPPTPNPPAAQAMVAIARDFGVSPFQQLREMG